MVQSSLLSSRYSPLYSHQLINHHFVQNPQFRLAHWAEDGPTHLAKFEDEVSTPSIDLLWLSICFSQREMSMFSGCSAPRLMLFFVNALDRAGFINIIHPVVEKVPNSHTGVKGQIP